MAQRRAPPSSSVQREPTPDLVRQALACIPPDVGHDERVRIFAAAWDGIGDAACDLVLDWSAGRAKPDAAQDAATWKSVRKPGGVKVATLFFIAKQHGFKFPEAGAPAPAPDPAELERQRAVRQRRESEAEAEFRARADGAAIAARRMWEAAAEVGESAYLRRKGVGGHGVRYLADGMLLVPMRNAAGELMNVQRIAPTKPDDGPEKRYLGGGRKQGLWHQLGDATGAPVLLLAEGYATAATLHEATGRPVAVGFDAGNLAPVAKELRKLHPAALILVCGDDDAETEQRTGTNPGRKSAAAAARAVLVEGALAGVVFPAGLPPSGTDFNDLAAHAGAEAVRALVEQAVAAPSIPKPQRGAKSGDGGANEPAGRPRPRTAANDAPDDDGAPRRNDPFTVDASGLWHQAPGDDRGGRRRVCDSIEVLALARDANNNRAALLLRFDTPFVKGRRWMMPLSMLAGDGVEYRRELLSQGFVPPADRARRAMLSTYLQTRQPDEIALHTSRIGWHRRCYVLPDETIGGNDGERVIFHSESGIECNFGQRGTLEAWKRDLARLCIGNSRLAFAVSVALAGPLLAWSPVKSGGGLHYVGDTSTGKTTGLLIAASVWGMGAENHPLAYMQKWKATGPGIEFQGEQHNDCTLILDEIALMDANELGAVVYALSDGAGKTRSKAAGGLRPKASWRLLFMSSGELTPEQHMATVGKAMKGGQEVRLIPMPAEVTPGSCLETTHEFEGGHELSEWVKLKAATCYGWAGRRWIEWLTANTHRLPELLATNMDEFERRFVREESSGQVRRGARRFALVAAAGEIASQHADLTGWPAGEAMARAGVMYAAWIDSRAGGIGTTREVTIFRQVKGWLEKNGESLLTVANRGLEDHKPSTPLKAGYRRLVDGAGVPVRFQPGGTSASDYLSKPGPISQAGAEWEYLIYPEQFRSAVCKGEDDRRALAILDARGHLGREAKRRDGSQPYSNKLRLPGEPPRSYIHIKPSIMSDDFGCEL